VLGFLSPASSEYVTLHCGIIFSLNLIQDEELVSYSSQKLEENRTYRAHTYKHPVRTEKWTDEKVRSTHREGKVVACHKECRGWGDMGKMECRRLFCEAEDSVLTGPDLSSGS
jgi:hypothetical protein